MPDWIAELDAAWHRLESHLDRDERQRGLTLEHQILAIAADQRRRGIRLQRSDLEREARAWKRVHGRG